jgi:catechol 2,3-dioxygenase-like lactoylglutathione lyase family enzyme
MKPRASKKAAVEVVTKKAKVKAKTKVVRQRSRHDHPDDDTRREPPAVRPQPLIAVRDVAASSRWYARLLGAETLGVGTRENVYDRVLSRGRPVLQLHASDKEDHPKRVGKDVARLGHGVLLWFELDDFDSAVKRARAMKATIIEEPHVNPGPQHREMWLRDRDGYVVVVTSPDGEAG